LTKLHRRRQQTHSREYQGDGCLPKDKQAAETDERDERDEGDTGSDEGETGSGWSDE